jgi:RNA-directed DNA polymerase
MSTLHHVTDLEWMQEAYRLTRKDGAPGIDGVTADEDGWLVAAARHPDLRR